MRLTFFIFMGMFALSQAMGMTVEVHGNTIYASGPVEDDYAKFRDALDRPGMERVVLVNSTGGDLLTGLRVGRLIADKGLTTVIAGSCQSSCSIMFMGGKERLFSDAFAPSQTFIGIHGAHDIETKRVNAQFQPQIYAFYKLRMAERFNAEVMNRSLYDMNDAGAMLRVYDVNRLPRRITHHCKSAQSLRRDCTDFKDEDAITLGIVTSSELVHVDLPASMRTVPRILGRELTQPLENPNEWLKQIGAQQCTDASCLKLISDYSAASENKALASAIHGPGLGYAGRRDTAINAFVGAIYGCNHPINQAARLCEARTANGFDLRDLYSAGDASHVEALDKLRPPSEKFFANEQYGGGLTDFKALRVRNVHDITPQTLQGIRTFSTQELAQALKSSRPPVVIDVWGGVNDAIPTAVTLLFGGAAFDDAKADKAFETRFLNLLKLFAPESDREVVFYCMSRDCWLSVNASVRARSMGYTQVGWYRGGIESWKAAGLPTASVVVRAVAN